MNMQLNGSYVQYISHMGDTDHGLAKWCRFLQQQQLWLYQSCKQANTKNICGWYSGIHETVIIAVGETKGIHNQTAKTAKTTKTGIQRDTEIYKCFKELKLV